MRGLGSGSGFMIAGLEDEKPPGGNAIKNIAVITVGLGQSVIARNGVYNNSITIGF